jgi:hypothetical protein
MTSRGVATLSRSSAYLSLTPFPQLRGTTKGLSFVEKRRGRPTFARHNPISAYQMMVGDMKGARNGGCRHDSINSRSQFVSRFSLPRGYNDDKTICSVPSRGHHLTALIPQCDGLN